MAIQMELVDAKEAPVKTKGTAEESAKQKAMNEAIATYIAQGSGKVGKLVLGDGETTRSVKSQISWAVRRYNEATNSKMKAETYDSDGAVYFTVKATDETPAASNGDSKSK